MTIADAILDALIPSRRLFDQWDDPSARAPYSDFWYTPLGIPEMAGAPTANSQLFVSACFAATRLLSGIGSTSPLNLMRKYIVDERVKREVQENHPVHRMLNFRPNADQTAVQWRSQQVSWQINWGTSFAEIQRDVLGGPPVAFWSIHPRRMQPFRDPDLNLWWHIKQADGTQMDIPDLDLLRFPYSVSEDGGITGLGVAYQARRAIGLNLTMEKSESQSSKTGVPRIIVEVPKAMSPDSRQGFRREWKELHEQGAESVALLTEGAQAKPLDWKMTDAQFVQRREFLIEELARWYDVPQGMLRRAIKELAGNVEQQGIDFKTYSLRFLDVWLQELAYKLLTPQEIADGYYFAFDFTDLLRGDLAALSEFYRSMNSIGVYSANDILDRLGENPHDQGDIYFVQGAMRPIDEPYNANQPQDVPGEPKDGKGSPSEPFARMDDVSSNANACHGPGGTYGPCPQGRNKKRKRRSKKQVPSAKSIRAKAAHHMVDSHIQRYSEEHNEPRLAKKLGGKNEPDNKPYDVLISKPNGKAAHGIELKTMVSNKANKLTMKGSAQDRKAKWEVENKAVFHTVVYDDQKVYSPTGDHASEKNRQIFYRRGGGSFRVDTMHPVKDHAELKTLINAPDSALPKAAQATSNWKARQAAARGGK